MNKASILFFVFIIIFSCKTEKNTVSDSYKGLPKNTNQEVVRDLSHTFNTSESKILVNKILSYEKTSTNEIAILTIDSISPYTDIQKFGTDIANLWGVGKKDINNGLLIVLCNPCRKASINTGNGTQKIITDSISKTIIDNTMIPSFKKNEYFKGINNALDSIIKKWH